MKKLLVLAIAVLFAASPALAGVSVQQPELTPEKQSQMLKMETKKKKEIEDLKKDEEGKAKDAKEKADRSRLANIEKYTNSETEKMHKKEAEIESKKAVNIQKKAAKIEAKYQEKSLKVNPVQPAN